MKKKGKLQLEKAIETKTEFNWITRSPDAMPVLKILTENRNETGLQVFEAYGQFNKCGCKNHMHALAMFINKFRTSLYN